VIFNRSSFVALCALIVSFLICSPVSAVFIPVAGSLPNPSTPGDGLNGEWFANQGTSFNNFDARNHANASTPTALFKSTLVDYPRGVTDFSPTNVSLNTFISPDTITSGSGTAGIGSSIIRLRGYINITQAMDNDPGNAFIDVDFALSSDDGSDLMINGVEVCNADGVHFFNYPRVPGTAKFAAPGLYPVEMIYFENGASDAGIELYSSILPGARVDTIGGTGLSIVPTNVLYAPEPMTGGLIAMLSSMITLRRRRFPSSLFSRPAVC
jgi:hypothetical protein